MGIMTNAHDLKNAAKISMFDDIYRTATPNSFGSCRSISAVACRNDIDGSVPEVDAVPRVRLWPAVACRVTMMMFSTDAAMASVFAPRRTTHYSTMSTATRRRPSIIIIIKVEMKNACALLKTTPNTQGVIDQPQQHLSFRRQHCRAAGAFQILRPSAL